MDLSVVAKQVLLFGHLVCFALALAAILREDLRLFLSVAIDTDALAATATAITRLLIALWVTGIALVVMDVGLDFGLLLQKPKLMTKIIVVSVLTLNGVLLHAVAFPLLAGGRANARMPATIATVLGAVSTTSWLYASFVGAARIVAPYFSLYHFLALYLVALIVAISIGILVVRDRLERMLMRDPAGGELVFPEDKNWVLACSEFDAAMAELGRINQQLRAAKQTAALPSAAQSIPDRGHGVRLTAGARG